MYCLCSFLAIFVLLVIVFFLVYFLVLYMLNRSLLFQLLPDDRFLLYKVNGSLLSYVETKVAEFLVVEFARILFNLTSENFLLPSIFFRKASISR